MEFEGQPKVEAYNPNYRPGGGHKEIFNEKVDFDAPPKVDHVNHDYKRKGGQKQVKFCVAFCLHRKFNWSYNVCYGTNLRFFQKNST